VEKASPFSTLRCGELASQLTQPTRHLHHPLPHRPNRRIIPTALRVHEMKRLALYLRPEWLHQPPLPQFILDQLTAHQCHALRADGGGDGVGLVGEDQPGADVQPRHVGEFLPRRPMNRSGQGGLRTEVDQRVFGQLGYITQAEVRAADRDEGVVEQLLRHQPGPAAVPVADGDIRRDAIQRHRFMGGVKAQVDIRMGIAQQADPGHQPAHCDRRCGAEGDRLAAGLRIEAFDRGADAVERGLQRLLQLAPRVGQFQLSRFTQKQRHAERLLQRANLVADRCGRDGQLLRSLFGALVPGSGFEGSQRRKRR